MSSVTLDQNGRLVALVVAPMPNETPHGAGGASTVAPTADWNRLFADAGLPIAQFSPVEPHAIPPIFADARAAWEGAYPERPGGAHSDRSGGRGGEARVPRDRCAVDATAEAPNVSSATRRASVSVS